MPGPAQKHSSRRARRNGGNDLALLPEGGRQGDVPQWPLGPDVAMSAELDLLRDRMASAEAELADAEDGRTRGRLRRQLDQMGTAEAILSLRLEQARDAEVELWVLMWGTPQAVMWDQSAAFERMVAQWVRWNVRAEQGDLKAAVEARLRGAELGLTPSSLLKLRKEIAETTSAEERGQEQRERRRRREIPKGGDQSDPRGGLFDA